MDTRRKLAILADAAKYDASCASSGSRRRISPGKGVGSTEGMGICHSYTPDGRCVSLLKILLTNHCIFDCRYCVNRVSSDVERARFTPSEVVALTLSFYRRNYIEGLFLSSGIRKSPDATMEQMIEVARSLREEHAFGGYIHLKAVAGASSELVKKAGTLADRVSCNIELPTESDLARFAPEKRLPEIHGAMGVLASATEEARVEPHAPSFLPAGQSTQMIVGATPASDAAILDSAKALYDGYRLRRVYYSAFSPIPDADARLPSQPPPLVREHRLYQADWLLRFYGFDVSEITPPDAPFLSAEIDPKLAWALRHRELFPIDVNEAPRELLLRVPGLGARAVQKILHSRRLHRLSFGDLAMLRVPLKKARPFLLASDPARFASDLLDRADLSTRLAAPRQLELAFTKTSARTGEL